MIQICMQYRISVVIKISSCSVCHNEEVCPANVAIRHFTAAICPT